MPHNSEFFHCSKSILFLDWDKHLIIIFVNTNCNRFDELVKYYFSTNIFLFICCTYGIKISLKDQTYYFSLKTSQPEICEPLINIVWVLGNNYSTNKKDVSSVRKIYNISGFINLKMPNDPVPWRAQCTNNVFRLSEQLPAKFASPTSTLALSVYCQPMSMHPTWIININAHSSSEHAASIGFTTRNI